MQGMLFPWCRMALGSTPFYDPSDPLFWMEPEERRKFERRRAKGAPIGFVVFAFGVGLILLASLT
ncbi:MAG: hypothetical protein PWQ91_1835 [Eubacteriales bacterium]|nr:hypothetical protein [Eubacteriales bacterium]